MYGAENKKATDFVGNVMLSGASVCTHELKTFSIDGKFRECAHHPLCGTVNGEFRTRRTAAYPAQLNEFLANALTAAAASSPVAIFKPTTVAVFN